MIEDRLSQAVASTGAGVSRRDTDGPVPMSSAQQRLWFLDQLRPGLAVYNVPVLLRLRGSVDAGTLERALEHMVNRHESLRTVFGEDDGRLLQYVRTEMPLDLKHCRVQGQTGEEREQEARRLCHEAVQGPFDLTRGPLMRSCLVSMDPDHHLLCCVFHHIVFDGWSVRVFLRELSACYAAVHNGAEPALPPLPVQYPDVALWQHTQLDAAGTEAHIQFWQSHLAGADTAVEVIGDYRRPAMLSMVGSIVSRELDPALVEKVQALCRDEGVTLYTALFAAWNALLFRYAGQEDIVTGTAISGRTRREFEDLIGFFVNTVPVHTHVQEDASYRAIARQLHGHILEIFDHQDLPFERIVEAVHPDRDLSHSPLFRTMFAFETRPEPAGEFGGLDIAIEEIPQNTAKFDLTLFAQEAVDGVRCTLEYSTDLYEADTASRILEHFTALLESLAANPDAPLWQAALAPRETILAQWEAWNRTSRPFPVTTVHALFQERASATPDAPAIEFGEERLTYGEVDAISNQLARYLEQLNVGAGDLVGLCLDRGVRMAPAVLAILKVGAAYVPLDPEYPRERLRFMVEDSGIKTVVTLAKYAEVLPDAAQAVFIDTGWPDIAACPAAPLPRHGAPDAPAYVMYTSGSTGQPKGVCVSHRAILRLVVNTDYVTLGPGDRLAQISTISFDAATFELWGALLNGGCIAGIDRETVLSPLEFGRALREQRITAMFVTVSLFNKMAAYAPNTFRTVRSVLVGGEACDPHSIREVLVHGAPERLLNGYGPTETTTFAVCHLIDEVHERALSVPIGRPIANTTAYVLDAHRQPVPPGVPGELYLGGDGVALGYWNRPGLTAERFLPDPFSPALGRMMYKTGDLVRQRADGVIEFLGRLDQQVKLRGYRIELGEIEAVLSAHPSVREAVVRLHEDRPGEKRLVAYVVAANGKPPKKTLLRQWLAERLPAYMTPADYVPLDAVPLTANGKLDARALPAPPRDTGAASAAPPDSATERSLAEVWEAVLGLHGIGRDSNFFVLGGHSLLAIRLVAEIRNCMGVELPLRIVFMKPVLACMAQHIDAMNGASTQPGQVEPSNQAAPQPRSLPHIDPAIVSLRDGDAGVPFYFVAGAGAFSASYLPLVAGLAPGRPVYCLEDPGLDVARDHFPTVEEQAARYIEVIRKVQPSGPYRLGGYSFGGIVSFEMAQQLTAAGEEVDLLAIIDTQPCHTRSGNPALGYHVRRFFHRLRVLYCTAPLILRYAREALVEAAGRAFGKSPGDAPQPTWRQYYLWVLHDVTNEYLRKQAGIKAPPVKGTRLHAAREGFVRHVTETVNHSRRAMLAYCARQYPGRVTLLRAKFDPTGCASRDPSLGWRRIAQDGVDVRVVSGNHAVLLSPPYVIELARELNEALIAADTH